MAKNVWGVISSAQDDQATWAAALFPTVLHYRCCPCSSHDFTSSWTWASSSTSRSYTCECGSRSSFIISIFSDFLIVENDVLYDAYYHCFYPFLKDELATWDLPIELEEHITLNSLEGSLPQGETRGISQKMILLRTTGDAGLSDPLQHIKLFFFLTNLCPQLLTLVQLGLQTKSLPEPVHFRAIDYHILHQISHRTKPVQTIIVLSGNFFIMFSPKWPVILGNMTLQTYPTSTE